MEMEHRPMRRKDRLVTEEGEIRRILDAAASCTWDFMMKDGFTWCR